MSRISQMPPANPLVGDELIEVVQDGQNRKAYVAALGTGGGGHSDYIVLPGLRTGYLSYISSSGSTSAYAMKGNIFDAVEDVRLAAWIMRLMPSSTSERYKLVIYRISKDTGQIEEVVYESGTYVPSTTGTYDLTFAFKPTLLLEAGNRYVFVAVRTDGSASSACRCAFPGSPPAVTIPGLSYYGCIRQASLVLGVGGTVELYTTDSHVGMDFILVSDDQIMSLHKIKDLSIANGDFEEEELEGWTVTKGTPTNGEPDNSSYANIAAKTGSEFLKHGNEDGQDFEVEQELDLVLPQGGVMQISAYAATADLADQAYCEAEFIDPYDQSIETQRKPMPTPAVDLWFPQQCLFRVPEKTMKVKLRLGGQNGNGDVTDVAIDQVSGWYAPVLPATPSRKFRGALARLSANKNVGTTPVFPIPWDYTEYDTDGFWDLSQPGRFTIPKGVSMIRLHVTIDGPSNTFSSEQNWVLHFAKNGSTSFYGSANMGGRSGYSDFGLTTISPVIPVVEGDYFEVRFNSGHTANITLEAATSCFSIEVLE